MNQNFWFQFRHVKSLEDIILELTTAKKMDKLKISYFS